MKRKIALTLLILAAAIIITPYIFADPNVIEGTVRSIESNEPLTGMTITVVNCTNHSQIFNTTVTYANGSFSMAYNQTWGPYLVNVSGSGSYLAKQFSNNSQCFVNGTEMTLQVYRIGTSTLNVTLKDIANGRPIPDATIKLYRSNYPEDPPIDQSNNYRCTAGVCKTDIDGNITLIVPNPGTYNITIESNDYDNWNETLPTFNSHDEEGKNRDYIKTLRGISVIGGTLTDFYNNKGIENALIELYKHDSDPNSGENLSFQGIYNYSTTTDENGSYKIYVPPGIMILGNYNIKTSHNDYTSKLNYNNNLASGGGWDSLNANINVQMNGTLLINGSIYDCNNNDTLISLDIYVTDKTADNFNYHIQTDNGNFSLYVKNTTIGYNGYNITINGTQYDATILANAAQNITDCVDGSQRVNGTIKDIENNWNLENATVIINLNDGTMYTTTTIVDGTFDIQVKGGVTFSIDISKKGYEGRGNLVTYDGIYGTIYLTGAHLISGYVEDIESTKRTAGKAISNVTVRILNATTETQIYNTTTDSNGHYSINIPSNINYTISWNKNLYHPKNETHEQETSPNTTTYLTGNTHLYGTIQDESPYAVNKNITDGVIIEFTDAEGLKYTLEPETHDYSIYMAIENYNMTASKTGYTPATETGFISGSNIRQDINLRGSLNITAYTTDDFSSMPISLIKIRLLDNITGLVKYDSIQTLNGMANIYADSGQEYNIVVYDDKFMPMYKSIEANETENGTISEKEYRMIAKYETKITDIENGEPVENAMIQAYHYFNETYYTPLLNETRLIVTVNCSGSMLDDINVTVTGGAYSDSRNTTAGIALFSILPVNTYTVQANGSIHGCSTNSTIIDISQGGITHYTTIWLNTTTLVVHILNPIQETIYPANVSYQNSTGDNITMQSLNNTYYYINNILPGTYNVSVNESNHHDKFTTCNVTTLGVINYCNITIQPMPGNLSIYVSYDGSELTGATVNITNGTGTYQNPTAGGWTNFTDIESLWNITINATGMGLQLNSTDNAYVYPNNNTIKAFSLENTTVTITVADDLGHLQNATVSLTDSSTGAVLANYLGTYLTGLTDADGNITFIRFNQSSYNLTINETSHEYYNQTIALLMDQNNSIPINLDTTRATVNVEDTYGIPIEDIYVTLDEVSGPASFSGYTNSTGTIILDNQTFPPGQYNLTVDGTGEGYNYTTELIDIYPGSQTIKNVVLEEFRLTVYVNGSYDNLPIYGVTVTITDIPLANTTDTNGITELRNLENTTYNITINGTGVGYNDTTATINITGDTYLNIILTENTYKITVMDEEGNPVNAGVWITFWDGAFIYENARDNDLNEQTNTTDNNVTFREMKYESGSGKTVTMVANGSDVGYGINQSTYLILNGTNSNTTTVNITQLLVNVTDSSGAPVNAANVTMLNTSGGAGQNGLGQLLEGQTASNGTITFKRIIAGTYNVSIEKNVSGTIVYNSTLITISAGEHAYVHIDPNNSLIPSLKGTYYSQILENDTYNLTINVTVAAGPLENITVKIFASGYNYSDSYWYNYEDTDNKTTDAEGIIIISEIPAGVYDIEIDGEDQGYGITQMQMQFGKLVFANDKTGIDGIVSIFIDGREIDYALGSGYYIRITTAGYRMYDTLDRGESAYIGSYYDHAEYDQETYPGFTMNNRTDISITGLVNIVGTITDKFATNAQDSFKYLANTIIQFILHGTGTVRYTTYTDINGTYSINVSPVLAGAQDFESPLTYSIRSSKTGYIPTTVDEAMPTYQTIITSDNQLPGTHTASGTVLSYDSGNVISGIIVKYIDNATISEIYSTTTDAEGKYSLTVNPNYQPYKLSFQDPTSNTNNYTTQSYTEPHTDEIYYLLKQDQAMINLYVIDDYSEEVNFTGITIYSEGDNKTSYNQTNQYGKLDFFIDGEQWDIGSYNLTADGTSKGYGLTTETRTITSGYNTVTIILNTTKINVSVASNLGNSVYNITADMQGSMEESKDIENSTVIFSKITSGNYTITFNSPYFSQDTINITVNDSNAGTSIQENIILNESMISIRVINQSSIPLENISISVYGPTQYIGKTNDSGWLDRTQILEGNYTLNFTNRTQFIENDYFVPDNISITQVIGNTTYIEVTAVKRIINISVKAYDLKDIYNASRTEITDDTLNISLTNDTGITSNKTGYPNYMTTTTGIANFTDIYDGEYRINASGINYTYDNSTTFNTTASDFTVEQDIYLKQNNTGYINVTVISSGTPLGDAQVSLYWNSTTLLESKVTDASGRAMLSANTTTYNSTLHLEISKTGYITVTTASFNITTGQVYDNTTTLTLQSSPPPPPGGGTSSSSKPPPTVSIQPSTQEDEPQDEPIEDYIESTEWISYTYSETQQEIENIIMEQPFIYSQLEQIIGTLSEEDINKIIENTIKVGKNIEISRDIKTEKTGETTIGLNIYYWGKEEITNFIIYDMLPSEIITINDITITDTVAEVFPDENTDSYFIRFQTLGRDAYKRIEYKTDKYISTSEIDKFQKPIILATDLEKIEPPVIPNLITEEPRQSILDYWWILAIAVIALAIGLITTIKLGYLNIHSFKPIETNKPLKPPYIPAANTPFGFGNQNPITALPKAVTNTVDKIEKEISKDIRQVAQKEAIYLTKQLEKEKFIVD